MTSTDRWFWRGLIVLFLACFVMLSAYAATKHTVTYAVSLYKSTSKVKDVAGTSVANAQANCETELAKQTVAATYSCKTPVTTDIVTIVPDPPPLVAHLSWHWTTEIPAPPNLTGYRIQYGQAFDGTVCQVSGLTSSVSIGNLAAYDLAQDLKPGTWCFAIRSVSPDGEGDLSSAVVKTL